jgi:hypothetical protein
MNEFNNGMRKIHGIWWDFCDYMKNKYSDEDGIFNIFDLDGYPAMCMVDEYVEKHPEIKICRCDDSYFSGSDLILIPHPTMGITVLYIPQNSGIASEFFLYPNDIDELIIALKEIKEEFLGEEI